MINNLRGGGGASQGVIPQGFFHAHDWAARGADFLPEIQPNFAGFQTADLQRVDLRLQGLKGSQHKALGTRPWAQTIPIGLSLSFRHLHCVVTCSDEFSF